MFWLISALVVATSISCTQTPDHGPVNLDGESKALRPLSESEALSDYDTMIASIRSLYGPLEYKQRRFGYNFETEAAAIRTQFAMAKTDGEKQALFYNLLRKLEDGHVSLSQPIRERMEIPMILMPIEGKFIVTRISPALAPYGLALGDEVTAVDGLTPEDGLKIITKYTWFANVESDRHMIFYFLNRPSYITELIPKSSFAQIEFVKPDGSKRLARVAWRKTSPQDRVEAIASATTDEKDDDAEKPKAKKDFTQAWETPLIGERAMVSDVMEERLQTMASIGDMGLAAPWYWNAKLKKKYGFTMVAPERDRVKNFYAQWTRELTIFEPKTPDIEDLPETLPVVWAGMYRYNGKTVLMMRQPTYSVQDIPLQLAIYSALIEQYQPIADTLVIDQTHNPGGAVIYAESFVQLFAPNGTNSFVQFLNADRSWFTKISAYWTSLTAAVAQSPVGARLLATVRNLERDSEAGLRLTQDPFSFSGREVLPPAPGGAVWKKPVVILIDELCASGGDAVPMLIKSNGLARIFGNRTAGMGGSVEKAVELPFTRASLNLTRGLFTTFKPSGQYTDADFIENNGVVPDVVYKHTVQDMRDGFLAYFKAFSDEATK